MLFKFDKYSMLYNICYLNLFFYKSFKKPLVIPNDI